jgi:hypothetical protein
MFVNQNHLLRQTPFNGMMKQTENREEKQ